jgi:Asp-tRNA(Asn)/Glu-tRNA(Gln) amidotransferase C subunit
LTSNLLVQLLLGGFGITGFVGAAIALLKLRPEANTAAVEQAQSVMGSMKQLNDVLQKQLDDCNRAREELDQKLREAEKMVKDLSAVIHGYLMVEDEKSQKS